MDWAAKGECKKNPAFMMKNCARSCTNCGKDITVISQRRMANTLNLFLLYRQESFTGKYTTRKIHTKLHPGPEWRIFHVLTSEDIDDIISRSFHGRLCKQSVKNGER